MMKFDAKKRKSAAGFTLLELMIVVAIVAILAAFAYPSYLNYVTKSNRGVAKAQLMKVSAREEQYFANNKQYTEDLTNLGFSNTEYCFDHKGEPTAKANAIYCITETDGAASPKLTYSLTASQTGTAMAGSSFEDTECGALGMDETGLKTASGSGTDCW